VYARRSRRCPEQSQEKAKDSHDHRHSPVVLCSISDVERDIGVAKETLRVWERRYGFPSRSATPTANGSIRPTRCTA
jgi:hypothetical protein